MILNFTTEKDIQVSGSFKVSVITCKRYKKDGIKSIYLLCFQKRSDNKEFFGAKTLNDE